MSNNDFTDRQLKILALAPRVAACISLLCAVHMGRFCWKSRDRLYHRLMLCLSAHLVLFSIWTLYGSAAIPPDARTWGGYGSIATCTAQGFFMQISLAIPFYYVCLSIYSFLAVRHRFDVSKYAWIEKWIHIGVHVFPIGSAFYLWHARALNPGISVCWIESVPYGCGTDDLPCTRGPDNIFLVALICAGLPAFVCLILPTTVMICLYRETKFTHNAQQTRMVAHQAALYLCALYWSYVFNIINCCLWWVRNEQVFSTTLLSSININLLGVWILGIYLYFSNVPTTPTIRPHQDQTNNATKGDETSSQLQGEASSLDLGKPSTRQKNSFNIFDGTNATGEYADFIYEGDSEDLQNDRQESMRWATIQDHV